MRFMYAALAAMAMFFASHLALAAEDDCEIDTSTNTASSYSGPTWCALTSTTPDTVTGPDYGSNVCVITKLQGLFHNTSLTADYVILDHVAKTGTSYPSGYAWRMTAHGHGDSIVGEMTCVPSSTFTISGTVTDLMSMTSPPASTQFSQVGVGTSVYNDTGITYSSTHSACWLGAWGGIQRSGGDWAEVIGGASTWSLYFNVDHTGDVDMTEVNCLQATGTLYNVGGLYSVNPTTQGKSLPNVASALCGLTAIVGPWTDTNSMIKIQNNHDGTRLVDVFANTGNTTPSASVLCYAY